MWKRKRRVGQVAETHRHKCPDYGFVWENGEECFGKARQSNEALGQILRSDRAVEAWRVGEAIAESYLVEHRHCEFRWPGGRDLKNPESSPAGTDLVGFQTDAATSVRFSFGEVKTSNHAEYPPSLMYGRHGLKQQLEGLRDSHAVKDVLVKYLGRVTFTTGLTSQFSAYLLEMWRRILWIAQAAPADSPTSARLSR
jgi:hypothetical protein